MCDSAVVFRELGLVRGMRTEVGEELKTGNAALGGLDVFRKAAIAQKNCRRRPCTST